MLFKTRTPPKKTQQLRFQSLRSSDNNFLVPSLLSVCGYVYLMFLLALLKAELGEPPSTHVPLSFSHLSLFPERDALLNHNQCALPHGCPRHQAPGTRPASASVKLSV